jgi:hypothetical protein
MNGSKEWDEDKLGPKLRVKFNDESKSLEMLGKDGEYHAFENDVINAAFKFHLGWRDENRQAKLEAIREANKAIESICHMGGDPLVYYHEVAELQAFILKQCECLSLSALEKEDEE